MVTRVTPGTGFMPSFIIALRLFFSLRLCLEPASPPPAAAARQPGRRAARNAGNGWSTRVAAHRRARRRRRAARGAWRARRTLSGIRQIRHVVVVAAVLLVVVLNLVHLGLGEATDRASEHGAKRRRCSVGDSSPKAMLRRCTHGCDAAGGVCIASAPPPWRPAFSGSGGCV
jgi:hypothetical protein